jgi:hypothetical protein
MTSVLRFLKQRPSDTQYFISLRASPVLSVFYADAAASTNTYVSGAAAGFFSSSTVTVTAIGSSDVSAQGIFRDMGVTVVSSMRTFRRVQLLILDGGISSTNNEWSAQGPTPQNGGTPGSGVWSGTTTTEGVYGSIPASGTADSAFNVFYFETGANGLGLAQGLIRYG